MELEEFAQNFRGYNISKELIFLRQFQDKFPDYSQGFYLIVDDKSGIKTCSENEEFLECLMPFAQANGTGSIYAIWNDGSDKLLDELPIIVFGDEGGVHIVAENVLQLMQMLTFDSEIYVDFDQVYFYKEEDDYEESADNDSYKNWLKEHFNVDPVEDPNKIIETAQQKYKASFGNWFRQYNKGE
jgi:hypothetical protein